MTINPCRATVRPRPEVECAQYIPGNYTKREWLEFCPKANIGTKGADEEAGKDSAEFFWFSVETANGAREVEPFGWVIKDGAHGWAVASDDTFQQTMILTEVEGVQVITFDPRVVK